MGLAHDLTAAEAGVRSVVKKIADDKFTIL
jgi:hypothetical protein